MHKKLAAALTIAIFVISTLAIVVPVQAHFTLGNLTGTYGSTLTILTHTWPDRSVMSGQAEVKTDTKDHWDCFILLGSRISVTLPRR